VLTIDPAKRLANSLGLTELGHDVQQVPPERLANAGNHSSAELFAMMLDQKRAFDEVVALHASDPEAVKRIIENPVYAQISGSLAGAQEYAALATLQQFDKSGEFDLIIVDTPPTANALDFLDAPQKLSRAIDSPAIEWFRRMRGDKAGGWSVVGRTGSYMLKRLSKFVGSQFLDDLAVFFTEFNDILGGFKQRAEETFDLLRQDRVGFVIVASPEPMAVREALQFHKRLSDSAMPFCGFVINRVHTARPMTGSYDQLEAAIAAEPSVAALAFSASGLKIASEQLISAHSDFERLAAADALSVARLQKASGHNGRFVSVPFFDRDIHSIERLSGLGRYFGGDRAGLD
jgi:anion-transporting  ArsA/GET3 family ATPase